MTDGLDLKWGVGIWPHFRQLVLSRRAWTEAWRVHTFVFTALPVFNTPLPAFQTSGPKTFIKLLQGLYWSTEWVNEDNWTDYQSHSVTQTTSLTKSSTKTIIADSLTGRFTRSFTHSAHFSSHTPTRSLTYLTPLKPIHQTRQLKHSLPNFCQFNSFCNSFSHLFNHSRLTHSLSQFIQKSPYLWILH